MESLNGKFKWKVMESLNLNAIFFNFLPILSKVLVLVAS